LILIKRKDAKSQRMKKKITKIVVGPARSVSASLCAFAPLR
jgi:hypothetical protein